MRDSYDYWIEPTLGQDRMTAEAEQAMAPQQWIDQRHSVTDFPLNEGWMFGRDEFHELIACGRLVEKDSPHRAGNNTGLVGACAARCHTKVEALYVDCGAFAF